MNVARLSNVPARPAPARPPAPTLAEGFRDGVSLTAHSLNKLAGATVGATTGLGLAAAAGAAGVALAGGAVGPAVAAVQLACLGAAGVLGLVAGGVGGDALTRAAGHLAEKAGSSRTTGKAVLALAAAAGAAALLPGLSPGVGLLAGGVALAFGGITGMLLSRIPGYQPPA